MVLLEQLVHLLFQLFGGVHLGLFLTFLLQIEFGSVQSARSRAARVRQLLQLVQCQLKK
jgi:hypothetical protein